MNSSIKLRTAENGIDTYRVAKLYQSTYQHNARDEVFSSVLDLEKAFSKRDQIWLIAERPFNSEFLGFMCVLFDENQNLAKLMHLRTIVNTNTEELLSTTNSMLTAFLDYSRTELNLLIDVMYVTSNALSMAQMESAISVGFSPIGVFPGYVARDASRVNGLSAYFKPGVLENERYDKFSLHSAVYPIFKRIQDFVTIPDTKVIRKPLQKKDSSLDEKMNVEMILAPKFVESIFSEALRKHQSMTASYYPFQVPNAIFMDENQKIKVFVRINREDKFATIVGEKMDSPCDLAVVYEAVSASLYGQGIQFIELLNDAADYDAIETALRAGFIPCCYFPSLKKHGSTRRDYVVQARSYERVQESFHIKISAFREFNTIFERLILEEELNGGCNVRY
jgi:hypothetical protein